MDNQVEFVHHHALEGTLQLLGVEELVADAELQFQHA